MSASRPTPLPQVGNAHPPHAASLQVSASQSQPFARAQRSSARWPPRAAAAQTPASQSQPFARAHCSTPSWPARAHESDKGQHR
jgi:hypothetical protein